MFLKSMLKDRHEDGYSLIGVLIALAIMAIVTSGIMMAIQQIYNVSSDRTSHLVAIREVQNAGSWLMLDGHKATAIVPEPDPDGFPLTMSWDDPDDNQHEVVYTVSPDNKLKREHYTDRITNPYPDSTTLVAAYVDPSETSCSISANDELVANITSAVNIDSVTYIETRTYRIFPRGSLH